MYVTCIGIDITNLISADRICLLQKGISEPIFHGDLVNIFKRIVGKLILVIISKDYQTLYKGWI